MSLVPSPFPIHKMLGAIGITGEKTILHINEARARRPSLEALAKKMQVSTHAVESLVTDTMSDSAVGGAEAQKMANYLEGAFHKPSSAKKGQDAVGALQQRAQRAVLGHIQQRLEKPLFGDGARRSAARPQTQRVAKILHEGLKDVDVTIRRARSEHEQGVSQPSSRSRQDPFSAPRRALRGASRSLDRLEKQVGHLERAAARIDERRQEIIALEKRFDRR